MFDHSDRYPGYSATELAMNEIQILGGYLDSLRAVLTASGLFSQGAIDAVTVNVRKFEKPPDGGLVIQDNRFYSAANHIYEMEVVASNGSEGFRTIKNYQLIRAMPDDVQAALIALKLSVSSFSQVERLAEKFCMAVNPQFPMTSPVALDTATVDLKATMATRRTFDEFFLVAIEALKGHLAVLKAKEPAPSSPPSGFKGLQK